MAKEKQTVELDGRYIDKRTWQRISQATHDLAATQAHEYHLENAFFFEGYDKHEMQPDNSIMGIFSEVGDLSRGWFRFVWLDPSVDSAIAEAGYENLRSFIQFAKEDEATGTHFYGTLFLSEFSNGEGDAKLEAYGFDPASALPDDELGFEFGAFASRVGLSRVWAQVHEGVVGDTEQYFRGGLDKPNSRDVAYALTQFGKFTPPTT